MDGIFTHEGHLYRAADMAETASQAAALMGSTAEVLAVAGLPCPVISMGSTPGAALVANEVDYVPLENIRGRISATLALIYPPGIGVVVPGERWDDRAQPMLDYFLAFQESFNRFPGFNYEVQGVFQERIDGRIRFFGHDGLGAERVRAVGERLRLPANATRIVETLIRHHLRPMHLEQAGQITAAELLLPLGR